MRNVVGLLTLIAMGGLLVYASPRVPRRRLSGGVKGQLGPIGPDLNLVKEWRRDEFIATMRTGVDPYGRELGEQMPWRPVGRMDDDELGGFYEYLTHLPVSQTTVSSQDIGS